MLGYPGEPGIMLLTLRDLFSEVANQKSNLHFEILGKQFARVTRAILQKSLSTIDLSSLSFIN